jgi:hypothetical protein
LAIEASASRTWAGTEGVTAVTTGEAAGFVAGFGAEFCADPASGAISRAKSAERSTEYLSLQSNGAKSEGDVWEFDGPGRERESGKDQEESYKDRNNKGSNTDHRFLERERILIAGVKNNG